MRMGCRITMKNVLFFVFLISVFIISIMLSACDKDSINKPTEENRESKTILSNSTESGHLPGEDESTDNSLIPIEESKNESHMQESDTSITDNPLVIEWYADLTHDGTDEKIVVDLTHINTQNEYKTVSVYTGKNLDTLIWYGYADTCHAANIGIDLYQKDGLDYLMVWSPYMSNGGGDYYYEIFYFSDEYEKITYVKNDLVFYDTINEDESNGIEGIPDFINELNNYLKDSFILVDTNTGDLVYSPKNEPLTKLYENDPFVK